MSLRAWVGVVATSFCVVIFYAGFWPAWKAIKAEMIASGVVPEVLQNILDKGLDWAPIMILIAAVIYAFVSPPYEGESTTWRG